MKTVTHETKINKDLNEKSVIVSREFNAPVERVWEAFTPSKILDQWWGPLPWRAETKTMNFTRGGQWLYAMVGPEGQKQWSLMNYLAINRPKSFEFEDAFCDENGNISTDFPVSKGLATFTETSNGTKVEFKMSYPTRADLEKLIETGFEEGITIGFDQLGKLIE